MEQRIRILKMYFEEQKPVPQIAKELGLSRTKVFAEINTAGKSMQVQLDAQIANIVRDSVSALAAMADEIKVDAEQASESVDVSVLRKRQATVSMYATMYDRVLPLVTEYWKRNLPALPVLPPPPEDLKLTGNVKFLQSENSDRDLVIKGDTTDGRNDEIRVGEPAQADGNEPAAGAERGCGEADS
jgi:transposase-like protein